MLDTNVVSDLRVNRGLTARVARWFASVPSGSCFISRVTIAEIRHGIERAPEPKRTDLEVWLQRGVLELFAGRVLDVGDAVLLAWLRLMRSAQQSGRTLSQPDALLAATALCHGLILVTRNTRDFAAIGIPFVNPWDELEGRA